MLAHTPALDGVRGIAILLVMLHHFTVFDPVTTVDRGMGFVALLGWSGVDLFFVLSGFLITGILIDSRGSARYFGSFYARRVLRIFPLYFLLVFLCFVVLPRFPALFGVLVGPGDLPAWPYWTYLVNFAVAERDAFLHGVLDVAWSLSIEEQFYLLWPAIVWLTPPRALGAICGTVVVGAPLLRSWALAAGFEPIDVYVLPHLRADALALGGLLAWLARCGGLAALAPVASFAAAAATAGVLTVAVASTSPWWWEPWMQTVGYSLFALLGAALVVSAVTRNATSRWIRMLSASWLRSCGTYSYCMYLVHLPVSRLLQEYVLPAREFPIIFGAAWPTQVSFYFIASVATYLVAAVSWHAFEAPILSFKKYFPYR